MTLKTENLAVVITDIVGYTEATEHKSRREIEQLLKNYTAVLLPIMRRFKGRLVKTIGDALLLVFKSPTDAMICAMAMQDAIFGYNRRVPPERQIHIRIAASLGEVRVDKNDIFGDPVNVTSRIESITPADEIYFSEAIYLAMNKAEVPAKEVGWKKLKGISSELRLYQIPRFATSVLIPEDVMGHADIGELSYPYGGTHLLAVSHQSSTIDRIKLSIDKALSGFFAYKYSRVGILAAFATLILALIVPRLWSNREKPPQTTVASRQQSPVVAEIPRSPSAAGSTSSSPSEQGAAFRATMPEPGQVPSTAETRQAAAVAPAAQSTSPAGQSPQPETAPSPSPLRAPQQPAERQAPTAARRQGQGAPAPGRSTGVPALAPTPIDAAEATGSETAELSQKTQTAAVSPQKLKPKADKSEGTQSLGKVAPEAPKAPPPPPWRHRITSFTQAKSAYANRNITAEEYRTIVAQLKFNYEKEFEQLKLDFRAGRIDKVEYRRRAVEIKTRYR